MEAAEAARSSGNALFKAQNYAEASQKYVDALDLLGDLEADAAKVREAAHKCRLNRAACLMKLQGYAAARQQCEAVLRDDAANAKAHWRLGQAAEALGELAAAQKSFTASVKLNPQLREPRDALEALRARLKANPMLDNALQDLRTVEERALRALHMADLPRARQQMELLLKDARSHKEAHWEARALLALAQLCTAEAEDEAAGDYLRSAKQVVGGSGDRRGLAYVHLTEGALELEAGRAGAAIGALGPGLLLVQELGDEQLGARFLSQLAAAHGAQHALPAAVELGLEALSKHREHGDRYSEATACANLGIAFRQAGKTQLAVEHLGRALQLGEELGYSNVLAVSLGQYALLQLERSKKRDRVEQAFQKLRRALAISEANGLARRAVDDEANLCAAALRWGHGPRADNVRGLEAALERAAALGYGAARARISVALGVALLRGGAGGGEAGGAGGGEASGAALPAAHAHLARGLALAEAAEDAPLQAEACGALALFHLLAAAAAADAVGALEQRAAAVHTARRARELGRAARGEAEERAAELTNLAVALLSAAAGGAEEGGAAAAEAEALLARAVARAGETEDVSQGVRARAALAQLLEARGEPEQAAARLDEAAKLYAGWLPLPHHAARLAVVAMGHHDHERWAEKLRALKELVAMLQT